MDLLSLAPDDRLRLYNTLLGDEDPDLLTGSWEWNTDEHICLWSDSVYAMLGIERGALLEDPSSLAAMVHPDDQERVYAAWDRAAQTGEAPPLDYRLVRPDGHVLHVTARGRTLCSLPNGGAVMVGTVTVREGLPTGPGAAKDPLLHRIQLAQPDHGGTAIGTFLGKQTTLSVLQYDLLNTLIECHLSGRDQPADVRGFYPSVALLSELPWETPRPDGTNLKQLIRRTRRLLEDTGLTIESRRGLGYRLTTTSSTARRRS